MLSINDSLVQAGLSDKEAAMYMTLLRSGLKPISFLATRAEMNRGTAYVILHSLMEKGLAVKSAKRNMQYFAPKHPEHLLHFLEHKQQELEGSKTQLKVVMQSLVSITNPNVTRPTIEFFDGQEGMRSVLEDTLTAKDFVLSSFLSIADIIEAVGGEFFNAYTTKRVKKGYHLKAIRAQEKDLAAITRDASAKRYLSSIEEKREIRYVNADLMFPISMYMYDNKLAVISSKEENFALIIESKELVDMQKKLFNILWTTASEKKLL